MLFSTYYLSDVQKDYTNKGYKVTQERVQSDLFQ